MECFSPNSGRSSEFGTGAVGAIAGLAFAAFFLALFMTGQLTPRSDQRLPVLIGGRSGDKRVSRLQPSLPA